MVAVALKSGGGGGSTGRSVIALMAIGRHFFIITGQIKLVDTKSATAGIKNKWIQAVLFLLKLQLLESQLVKLQLLNMYSSKVMNMCSS